MKRIGVIGAGRFGLSLAEALAEKGYEVILVDRNGTLVQGAARIVARAVQGDATNASALEQAGFSECDVAVVAIGSNIEASTLATANCKELEIPMVVAKATSELHGKILKKLGADRIVYPDQDSAHRLARQIADHGALDLLEITDGCSIAEIDVPTWCAGKTLAQADLRKKTGVTVLCIRRVAENPKKPRTVLIPGANDELRADDKLIVFGVTKGLDEIAEG